MLPEDLKSLLNLKKDNSRYNIIFFNEVDSTNNAAIKFAKENYPHGTVVLADEQKTGRGRYQRKWFSPKGLNIYMSILLKPEETMNLSSIHLINLVSSLSTVLGIKDIINFDVWPKWPNDIFYDTKKLGGILSESVIRGKKLEYIVTGIGINVNTKMEQFPLDIRDLSTSIFIEKGQFIDRGRLIITILNLFEKYYRILLNSKKEIIDKWVSLSKTINSYIRAVTSDKEYFGKAISLDENGFLKIKTDSNKIITLNSGDVTSIENPLC